MYARVRSIDPLGVEFDVSIKIERNLCDGFGEGIAESEIAGFQYCSACTGR